MSISSRNIPRTSDGEEVVFMMSEFDRAMDFDRINRERSYRNWRAYFGVDGGQWDERQLQKFRDEDRHAAQYNIIGPKVDTLSGSLASEVFDLDWKPIEGVRNSLTEAIKTCYFSDKDLCNYEKAVEDVTRDAMIYRGILKMEMSDRFNPLKNINFRRVLPGFFLTDPHWISDDDNDLEKAWEIFHMTALQIKNTFHLSNQTIEAHIQNDLRMGDRYDYNHRYHRHYYHEHSIYNHQYDMGNLHRVIEKHFIETINTERLIGQILGSSRYIPFPMTKDRAVWEKFMIVNKIDPLTIQKAPYKDRIHHVVTIVPSLMMNKPLARGISKVQPKRLPYIILSANRAHGQDKGIVDDVIDTQDTINKRESKLTDLIATATGGGKLANRDMFKTPEDKKRFEQRNNDPSYVGWVDGDELEKSRALHYINTNQYPSTLINQLERMYDIIDKVSKVPAAMDAVSESANESGILFDRKLEVSRLGLVTIINRIKNFRKSMAEMYFEQWQMAYNGPEREMSTIEGNQSVVLNKRVLDPATGREYIQNRPDQIPRCLVIVRESKSSPNRRLRDRAIYSELFNLSTKSNPEYTSFFFHKMIETMDLSDEDKFELEGIAAVQKFRDKQRLITEIATLGSQEKQAAMQALQAMMAMEQIRAQQQTQIPQQQTPVNEIPKRAGAVDGQFNDVGIPGAEPGRPTEQNILAPA